MHRHLRMLAHTLAASEDSSGPRTLAGTGSANRSDTPLGGVGAWIDARVGEEEAECAFEDEDVFLLATFW